MGAMQDLAAAGFDPAEVNAFAAQKRTALLSGGFSAKEANDYLGDSGDPDLAAGNKSLARTIGNAMKPALQTVKDMSTVYAPVETGLNAATGLLFGFPAYIGGALGGLTAKHVLGMDVDPKEMAETISRVFTYVPKTEAGQRLTGNVMLPLDLLQKGAEWTGQAVTRAGMALNAPEGATATAGAVTDATIQMLPAVLLGALGRRMGGNIPASEDFTNTAKIIAGDGAEQHTVANVEAKLRATYEATGIDPITVAEDAKRNPQVAEALTAAPKEGEPLPALYPEFETKAEGLAAEGEGGTPPGGAQNGQPGSPLLSLEGPTVAEQRTVDMNIGMNPVTAVKDFAEGYTPFVGVEAPAKVSQSGGFVDSLQKVLAPASRGPIAEEQAGIMRANFGEQARAREVALEKLKDDAAEFDRRPVEDSYQFIDAMEHDAKLDDPKLQKAAQGIRELLDQKRDEVQALGKGQLENFIENYFPHIWKDPQAAQTFFGRRPLTGSGAFLKERTFDTFREGLDAGLTPITTNPVELALLKAREMDRYIYGQNIFEEMKAADLTRFVKFGDKAPPGWTKINDKVARVFQYSEAEKGVIVRGEYYAPDEAATLINNHLSPGLQGNGAFDAYRKIGIMMNTAQLGLSLFHVGFTTLDSMVSRVALGLKQISRGDIVEGAGNVAVGVSPAQPFLNILKGDKLLRAYLGKLDDPAMAPIVDAIMQAGGKVKMDDFYRNATVNAFKQAVRQGETLDAAKQLLPTILDRVNAPIFEELVPRQKLGVYFDMAKDWIENNPEASEKTKRKELGKLWDSVDNRMGQLVYDNVFWNRALKDSLMATVRSVGWNLGTFRELGGGVADMKDALLGEKMSDRTAYVFALPLVAAMYGAVTQFAYTGEGPKEVKDLFFPRTGRIRPDGSEDRVSLPTYMKDVYAYAEDAINFTKYGSNPLQTLMNKAHPLLSTIAQMLGNEDFFGATIRNPSAPLVEQVKDEAGYLIKQIEPFSLRNYQQQAKLRGEEPSVGDYLTSPSMVGIAPSPGYITKTPEEKESAEVSKLRDPLMKKFRQEIKDGASPAEVIPKMLKAGLSREDIKFVIRSSGDVPRGHRMKSFGKEDE